MKHLRTLFFSAFFGAAFFLSAQSSDWQQHVDYTMDVQMDVKTYQYTGTQKLIYTNNSPDELSRVFYHLYYNAFQPGSEMDIRLQNIKDPDKRMMVDGKAESHPYRKVKWGIFIQNHLPKTANLFPLQKKAPFLWSIWPSLFLPEEKPLWK